MRSIATLQTDLLTWMPVSRRSFQLAAGDDLVATLDWATAMGSLASGEAADGSWTFKRVGFFRPAITVRDPGGQRDLAVMRKIKGEGLVLEFAGGPRFIWDRTRDRRREMAFFDGSSRRVISFLPRTKRFKSFAEVTLSAGARELREISVLALIGWYRMVLEQEDEEAMVIVLASG
jgi:hypothetical protein